MGSNDNNTANGESTVKNVIKQIRFRTDKNGRPYAEKLSPGIFGRPDVGPRWIRMGYDAAKLAIATGEAIRVGDEKITLKLFN